MYVLTIIIGEATATFVCDSDVVRKTTHTTAKPCPLKPVDLPYFAFAQYKPWLDRHGVRMALTPLQSHVIANSSGALYREKRYMPWGEERYANGTLPTTFRFTGQREQEELGLYFYQSRWYDAYRNLNL